MSTESAFSSTGNKLERVLGPYTGDFRTAAEESDHPVDTDVFLALEAIANGRRVPDDVARRITNRAMEDQR